jgi:hypothetical protein
VLGDARISLKNMPDRLYGMLVLDAFSADAVPVHLLTREAVQLYLSRRETLKRNARVEKRSRSGTGAQRGGQGGQVELQRESAGGGSLPGAADDLQTVKPDGVVPPRQDVAE